MNSCKTPNSCKAAKGGKKGLKGYNFKGTKGQKPIKDNHLAKSKERHTR